MAKKRLLSKNTSYKWLIKYILEPIKRKWDSTRENLGVFFKQPEKISVVVKRNQKILKKDCIIK